MAIFQPPPTYAEPVLVDERTRQGKFNPIWLKWFLDLISVLNVAGGSAINHNSTGSIQGGAANQYYHLTQAHHTAVQAHGVHPIEIHIFGAADGSPVVF